MKVLNSRYAYPLAVFCLIISITLQLVWLNQIYKAQKIRLKEDLDTEMGLVARKTLFASLLQETFPGSRYKDFFLSPQWLNLRMAFDDSHFDGLSKKFSFNLTPDSAEVGLSLFFNYKSQEKVRSYNDVPLTAKEIADERFSQHTIIHNVDSLCTTMHLYGSHYHRILNYSTNKPILSALPRPTGKTAYSSALYSYNLLHRTKYQLVITSLTRAVLYRMRLYLVSSLLLSLLTAITFYFILKLLRNQRLYAEARIAFTSNMTHELKTPVATVALALESIAKYKLTEDPARLNEYLDISRQELQRLNLMIDKVLNLEQAEQGLSPVTTELYDVQAGLEQVVNNMHVQLTQNESAIEFIPSIDPCFVNGDPVHLTNVFYNLIENAIKYGGKGVGISISCVCTGNTISIAVKDNGPGIDPVDQHKIFERFYRVQDKPNVHHAKGTGLGLSYVKQIVERHGGTVMLKSESGKGSSFIINLPAAS